MTTKKDLYKSCVFLMDCKNRNRGQTPPCMKQKINKRECIICGRERVLNIFRLCRECSKNGGIDNSGM